MKRWIFAQIFLIKPLGLSFLICLGMLLPSGVLHAGEPGDDPAFLQKKAAVRAGFQKEEQFLLSEKERIEKENQTLQKEIEVISNRLLHRQNLAATLASGFGLKALTGVFFYVLVWFFPIAVINHFLYLFLREKPFFMRYRKAVFITLAAMLVACLLPLMAQAQSEEKGVAGSESASLDPFAQKLDEVNRILRMSAAERQIAILEHARDGEVLLQKIPVKDSYLIPWKGSVETGSPAFLYSLASLYRAVGKEEKAQETLKRLDDLPLHRKWFEQYLQIYPRLLEMDLKNGQMMEASTVAHRLIEIHGSRGSAKALMDFSVFLLTHQMTHSANEAIQKAVEVVGAGQEAIDLTDYLLASNRVSEASTLLDRNINGSSNLNDLLPILAFCMEKNLFQETSRGIAKARQLCRTPTDDLLLSQFLFENGRKEESAKAIDAARERAETFEDLLAVAGMARDKGFLSLSIEAIEKAVMTYADAAKHTLPSPLLLGEKGKLPTDEPISLATYLGILQELDRRLDSALISYEVSPDGTLNRIVESYGEILEGNLNDFFYLKQFWTRHDPEQLKRLLPLYARLQEKALDRLSGQGEKALTSLREEIGVQKKNQETADQTLKRLRSEQRKATLAVFLYGLRSAAWMVFGILVAAGCVIKAVQAFRAAPRFKFFAFSRQFQEALGWSLILSIITIPVGVWLVLWGQIMGIFQSIEQGVHQAESKA
jgi:hypothetical protein